MTDEVIVLAWEIPADPAGTLVRNPDTVGYLRTLRNAWLLYEE